MGGDTSRCSGEAPAREPRGPPAELWDSSCVTLGPGSPLTPGHLSSPGDFQALSLCWHPSGDSLALLSKDHFCLCFLETEEGVHTAFGQRGDCT